MSTVGRVVALGEQVRVAGYALGGAVVVPAESDDEVLTAWDALAPDVEVVILTAVAAEVLGPARTQRPHPLTVVMPS
jgi:vacuolar-type H+-ATPase subunit F/Vma7